MKRQDKSIANTAIIAGVILIVALAALLMIKPTNYNNTINVQGIAEVKATPDLVVIYYTIEAEGETLTEAKDTGALIYKDLVSELVMAGFESDELKTESYNVNENWRWTGNTQVKDGYKATYNLELEMSVDDLDMLDKAIDAAVDSNTAIRYINFELTQESQNEYKAEAIKLASGDARNKAEALAEGFDQKLGKLVSVNINEFGYKPWNLYEARGAMELDGAAAKSAVSAINPSEESITASVSATYKLK